MFSPLARQLRNSWNVDKFKWRSPKRHLRGGGRACCCPVHGKGRNGVHTETIDVPCMLEYHHLHHERQWQRNVIPATSAPLADRGPRGFTRANATKVHLFSPQSLHIGYNTGQKEIQMCLGSTNCERKRVTPMKSKGKQAYYSPLYHFGVHASSAVLLSESLGLS